MDDTNRDLEPLHVRRNPVVIGTGLVALDVVIPGGLETGPQLRAGGTCGNVLTILSFLGWRSYPIARLSEDGASRQVADDLRNWGVCLDFVSFDEAGSTPVIIQHIRNNRSGEPVHSFSRKCPGCGANLPWYKPVRVADVTNLSPRLPKPQVFFFDRTSAAAVSLAKEAGDQGAIVFFEPSASSDPNQLEEALRISHIVKVSAERIAGNEAVLNATNPMIVIETQGSTGLRLRYRSPESKTVAGKWHKLPAFLVDTVRDTAGAGDWCSAGIIHMLGAKGADGLDKLTLDEVWQSVRVGQAMASWACGFDGPRGGMYVSGRDAFQQSVRSLLNGRTDAAAHRAPSSAPSGEMEAFACESCRVAKPTNVKKTRR